MTPLPVDVINLTNEIKEEVTRAATERNVTIENIFPSSALLISTDASHLREILLILLKNAIRYSNPQEGKVTLSVNTDNNNCVVSVAHNGTEISKDHRAHIFEKYWRSNSENKIEGTSFGMYIVKQLTERLGGEITFVSTPEQTTFSITLPLSGKTE